jgi:competence protein ComEC
VRPARALRDHALARPATTVLAAALAGLLLGPAGALALVPALAAAGLVAGTPQRCALLLCTIVVAGGVAHARTAALDRSALGPRMGHAVRASVPLLDTPRATAFGWRATALLRRERVLLQGAGRTPAFTEGEIVAVAGVLRAPGPREAWLRPRGMHAVLRAGEVRATGRRRSGAAGALDGVRTRAQRALTAGLPQPEGALLRGMVLGDDAGLSVEERGHLRRAGLGHLVAASGANVALLAVLALAACALLGAPLRARLLLVAALTLLYVPLAGGGPSIRRAGVMGLAGIAATLSSRPQDRVHALLLAAVVTLALDPRSVGDPGWQLSFAAVAAIAALGAPLLELLRARGVPPGLAEAAALTLAATIGTAPVSAAAFGTLSLAGIPANVLVAPLVGPITWIGMVASCAGQIWPAAGAWIGSTAGLPLGAVLAIGRAGAGLPAAQVNLGVGAALAAAAAASALVLWAPARHAGARAAPLLVLALIAAIVLTRPRPIAGPPAGVMRIALLDVGQGDATLVQSGGRAMLVDSGPPDGPVLERLRHLGIRRLDVLVGTHAQADHIGGADRVLRAMPVAAVLDGRDGVREQQGDELARAAAATGARLVPAQAGQRIRIGAVTAEVLSPPPRDGPPVAGADPNRRAVVLRVTGAGVRLLLTADAESDVLGPLAPGPAEILKVSHHGSADEGLARLLASLRPRLAVIEVGKGNTYGHPTPATLATLHRAGVRTLRTDRDGTVIVDVRAGRMLVHTHT